MLSSSSVLSTVVCTLSGCLRLSQISGKSHLCVQNDNKLKQPLYFPKTSTIANSCSSSFNAPALLRYATRHFLKVRIEVRYILDISVDRPQPLQGARTSTVENVCAHSLREKKEVCGPWINARVTAVVLLLHKALHSQSHRAYNSSQWVGEASFKPWRKSSYLPTPPPFLSLTHRHGQGPIREGCSMQYASHIALQHKQMELHLSNVG